MSQSQNNGNKRKKPEKKYDRLYLYSFTFNSNNNINGYSYKKSNKMDEAAKKICPFKGNLIYILANVEWINEEIDQISWPFVIFIT